MGIGTRFLFEMGQEMVVETGKRVIVEATDLSSTCFLTPLPATEGSETCPDELCSR
jgi:hypothetical protein